MKGTAADRAINKLFVGKMKSYVKCVNVDSESSRMEDFYGTRFRRLGRKSTESNGVLDIQLNVKGMKNLTESFKDYVAVETLEGDNNAMVKINDRHEFPFEIDLQPLFDESADKSVSNEFVLCGVLVHSGDLHGGHYFALIKPDKNTRWLQFDDDRVTTVTDKAVLEENYGGDGIINGIIPVAQRNQVRATKRMTKAMDTVLAPFTEANTPTHLKRRLDEERIRQEAKKWEREEQHLYLTAKVISESFTEHQRFDLATFDDKSWPPSDLATFRVLKTEQYVVLQNKTVRLGIKSCCLRFAGVVVIQVSEVRPQAFRFVPKLSVRKRSMIR